MAARCPEKGTAAQFTSEYTNTSVVKMSTQLWSEQDRRRCNVTTDKLGLIANLLATDNEEFDLEITNKFILFSLLAKLV